MSEQINDEDLKILILDTIRQINIENAAHTAPVYTLEEILTLKKVTELRELAKILQVKNYNNLRKAELISPIAKMMQNLDILRECIYTVDEKEWEFFEEVAAREYLQTDKVYFNTYYILQKTGLLQSFYHNDKLFYVVPNEIKAAYKKLAKTNFTEDKRFRDLINDYAIAAVSLYGVISQDDFVALFNSQNDRQTSIDEVFPILLNNIYAEIGYCLWDEYIVDDEFEEADFALVPWVLEERKGKSPYVPSKEEFLKYSDWDYLELTPQLIAAKSYLAELISDPDEVEDLLYEIHDMSTTGVKIEEYFDLLDSTGIVFDGLKQAKKMMQLIVDVQNNTRQWTNYGHTPNELHSLNKSNLLPFPSTQHVRSQKIARNAPCPCGSGKKYKKCCGKVDPA